MAVVYSKLGGCLGETAKLGPLASTDLCIWVKGLLDKLMTHLGLGSSIEESWELFSLLLMGGSVASLGLALLAWGVVLFSWEAWHDLAECLLHLPELLPACLLLLLAGGIAPASWEPALLVALEVALLGGWRPAYLGDPTIHLGNSAVCLGSVKLGWAPSCLGRGTAYWGDPTIHLGSSTVCLKGLGSPMPGWAPNCLGRHWPVTCLGPSISIIS